MEEEDFLNGDGESQDRPKEKKAVEKKPGVKRRLLCSLVCLVLVLVVIGSAFVATAKRKQSDETSPSFPDLESTPLGEDLEANEANTSTPLNCIPKQCFWTKHLIKHPELMANDKGFTLLASFPGAGNTWVRLIIEDGTRIFTGSVYRSDSSLLKDGFLGEEVDAFGSVHPQVSVIKTHFPLYYALPSPKTHFAIQILRSPFDSFLSEFNREFGRNLDVHLGVASIEDLRNIFPSWFRQAWSRYKGHVKFWDGPRFWEDKNARVDKGGVTSFLFHRPIFPTKQEHSMDHAKNKTVPVLVMFYEDFIYNFAEATTRLFSFLRDNVLGKAMPPVDVSVMCALMNHQKETRYKRERPGMIGKKPYNPYADPVGGIATRGLVKLFCDEIQDYWFSEKWGDCYQAQLQSIRTTPQPSPVLPTARCAT